MQSTSESYGIEEDIFLHSTLVSSMGDTQLLPPSREASQAYTRECSDFDFSVILTSDKAEASEFEELFRVLESENSRTNPQMMSETLVNTPSTEGDIYAEDDTSYFRASDDEAMEELLKDKLSEPRCQPPSSVLKVHDRDSRSEEEFDPNLRHSSPWDKSSLTEANEPVLEEDVDWEPVREHTNLLANDDSKSVVQEKYPQKCPSGSGTPGSTPVVSCTGAVKKRETPLQQLESQIQGAIKETFFHVEEMLQTKERHHKSYPDAVFRIFARVIYSSRENLYRRQYFQFRDLFKETPPYLTGALLN